MSYGKNAEGVTMNGQSDVILNYLVTTGFSISQDECTKMFGFTRLAARMFDIKERIEKKNLPYTVCSKIQHGTNRYGIPCKWKEWWIVKNEA